MAPRVEYEDEHRLFLQGIMARGVLNNKEVHALHEKVLAVCGIEVPEKRAELLDLLAGNIRTINDQLEELGMLIKKGVDEDTGESCFMLVNTSNRLVGQSRQLATGVQVQFTQVELDYLRLMATEILQDDSKAISSRDALNLMDQVSGKKLTLPEAEKTITKFINCRWLKMVEGEITLDVRFLGEMEQWMIEVVGGVAKCQMCRKVVVRGVYCTCEDLVGWHKYCLAKQTKKGLDTKCKKCGEVVHRAGGQEPRKRKKSGGEEVGKEQEEEQEVPSQEREDMPPPSTPGPSRRARRKVNVDSDSD